MNEQNTEQQACPAALPTVTYKGSRYIIDLRLGQFRELSWPIRFVDFGSPEGRELRWEFGVVPCPFCRRAYVMVNEAEPDVHVRCRRCGHVIHLG